MITGLQPAELPHSDIAGSKVVCTYPTLFAAYHVLRRLPEPRHPPFALFFLFLFACCTTVAMKQLALFGRRGQTALPTTKLLRTFASGAPINKTTVKGKTFACEIVIVDLAANPYILYIVNLIFRFAREVIFSAQT